MIEILIVIYLFVGLITMLVAYSGGMEDCKTGLAQMGRDIATVILWPVVWFMVWEKL